MEEVKQLDKVIVSKVAEDLSKFDGWNPSYRRNRLRIF
jgi:hypothetical protein